MCRRLHRYFALSSEESILRFSMAVTLFVTLLGVFFGLLAASLTILFDAVYELVDVVMTGLALLVARLITLSTSGGIVNKRLAERFSMGFWHLEPIVLGVNGLLLMGAAIYGLVSAVDGLMHGGRQLAFEYALVFAAISLVIELGAAMCVTIANRHIHSDFLALDAKSWLMSAAITVAYLFAFGFGLVAQGTRYEWLIPYIDPAALALVCLAVLPLPIGTVRRALADILLVTPPDLKQQVDAVAQASVRRYGFESFRSYVARVGRGKQIELYFIVPGKWPAKTLEEWDRIRDEISDAIGDDTPDRWLSIVFTTDPEWAH
ncbi:cation transporter [Achromobacter sp. F4_2707]|uniref:cation diffusion facilitator family transporter n=1 Tax=Achromobacter sp. F4_2707 TaxID=3114286 RepID=UPI0039C5B0FA